GGRRLVDDALDVETGDAAGILGRLTLRVVEVGGHRDHGFRDRFTEVVLGRLLHFLQHLRGDLRRRIAFTARFHPGVAVVGLSDLVGDHLDVLLDDLVLELTADQALDREQGVGGVGDGLALGRLADEDLTILGVGDDGGRGTGTFRVLDDLGLAALHEGHTGVSGAQVYANDLSHSSISGNL